MFVPSVSVKGLNDSGSLYCPSVSDDDSATDDEFSSSTTPSSEFIVFESELYKLSTKCHDCGSPVDSTTQKCHGSIVTITTNCINGILYLGNRKPQLKVLQLETY